MKSRYSFSSKKTKRATKSQKMQKQKQKYPKIVENIIDLSDIILEIVDSRFKHKTRNIELENKINKKGKNIIVVSNKSDLINKNNKKDSEINIYVSCKSKKGIKMLRSLIKSESKKIKKDDKIIVGIVGYPNTGKSSLINVLVGRKKAGTGADAGFTKGIQRLKLTQKIILLDTPGVIPEKEYSNIKREKLAGHAIVGGRSYSQVKDPEMIIPILMRDFKGVLEKHYQINAKGDSELLIEELGRKKGFLKKGNEVNFDKTARFILKEWQEGGIKI